MSRPLRCRGFVEQVSDYLDGALDEVARRRVADHARGCEGCDRYLTQLRLVVTMLAGGRHSRDRGVRWTA